VQTRKRTLKSITMIDYIKGAYEELVNHVVWPKWDEVYKMTIVVAIFSAIFAIFTAIVDYLFRTALQTYYKFIKS
jgi:preprotein translocase subunit SecE